MTTTGITILAEPEVHSLGSRCAAELCNRDLLGLQISESGQDPVRSFGGKIRFQRELASHSTAGPIRGAWCNSTMTTKEKIIRVIESLVEDASVDEAIDRLYLLRKIDLGIAQADADDVLEHEQFMEELEAENAG